MNIEELKRLAEAATPGPWFAAVSSNMNNSVHVSMGSICDTEKNIADARYIAAANPAAVLELIEKLDAAHAELEAIREDNHRMMLEIDGLRKELAKMREQEPVAWKHENGNVFLPWQKDLIVTGAKFSPLYAAPVPVPAPTVPDADSVARFEQWVLAQADARPNLKRGRGTLCNKYPDGSYHTLWVDMAWEGWNARAMLQSAEVTK